MELTSVLKYKKGHKLVGDCMDTGAHTWPHRDIVSDFKSIRDSFLSLRLELKGAVRDKLTRMRREDKLTRMRRDKLTRMRLTHKLE